MSGVSKIGPFDYQREFPSVFNRADPGFDAIVGNPPYVRVQALNRWAPLDVKILRSRYQTARQGNYDLYVVFVQRSLELLREDGRLGLIIPNKFLYTDYGAPLRELLGTRRAVDRIVHFGTEQVFSNATTYTCLLFAQNRATSVVHLDQVNNLAQWIASREAEESVLPWESLGSREWPLLTGAEASLMDKLQALPLKLGGVSEKIFQGVATSADSIFILELLEAGSGTSRVRSKALGTELSIESELLHPVLKGAEIRRYETPEPSLVILFPYSVHEERAYPITASEIERRYPLAFEYPVEKQDRAA